MVPGLGSLRAVALGTYPLTMKIAISLLSGVGYGGMTYFTNLIPALAVADRENEYHVFVPVGHELIGRVHQKNFIFHVCLNGNTSGLKRFLWEQLSFPFSIKKYKIDIIFTAKNLTIFLAPCKTVISIRNMEPLVFRQYDNEWKLNVLLWVKWQLTKWSVRKADHVVAVSQAVKDALVSRFPGIDKKVSVVYNGNSVPFPELQVHPAVIGEDGQSFILTASKFVAYANQVNLLRGYAHLVMKNPDTPPLWFAGGVHDAKYFAAVKKYVVEHRLNNAVRFLGLVPHHALLQLMRRAHVFVFPSTVEACPHTLIEAMACGAPIVSSITPPMSEICSAAAVYFDPNNPEDIARALERVLNNKEVRDRLRNNGLDRSAFFTWAKTAQQLIGVYAHVVSHD